MSSSRRKFLKVGAAGAAVGMTAACGKPGTPWRFFTIEEAQTLEAICEWIIPADQDPGAKWAGVVRFIDRQLVAFFKPFQKTYREGIAATDQASRSMFADRFVALAGDKQRAVLARLDKAFFNLVVTHTMQGYYGDPRHGGNRDAVSWRMLGVPPAPVRGRAHYDLRKG